MQGSCLPGWLLPTGGDLSTHVAMTIRKAPREGTSQVAQASEQKQLSGFLEHFLGNGSSLNMSLFVPVQHLTWDQQAPSQNKL